MQRVLDVAHTLFFEASMPALPLVVPKPDASLPLVQLATLTGKERKGVFRACGFSPGNDLVLLRALQHLTSLHGTEWLEPDEYMLHGHLSAHHWGPVGDGRPPLFGHPLCMSAEPRVEPVLAVAMPVASATHGCVGLLNQGSTCYLNSLLQTLFHLTDFRVVIYRMPTAGDVSDTKSIPFSLQRLFCLLQTSTSALSTKHLTTSFGWSSHESFVQHDIHELTRILLDNLEEKLIKSGMDNAVKRLFCGVQQNYINVPDADYCGVRDEPFYDLQLVVKCTSDIYKSFDALVEPEILDGKNKYCLEREGQKTYHRAEKGIRFLQFPPVMILHLARFDFDPYKGEMCKIFSRWDFYESLNLAKYLPPGTATPDLSEYQLHSVLVHSGSDAKFGHYYCFVKVGTTWLKFNDELVSEATAHDVFGANLGGSKLNYWGTETPLSTNAYLLVYLRKSLLATLLRPIGPDELPAHLVSCIQKEKEDEARREREKSEDHLYAKVHVVTVRDCQENIGLLHQHCPRLKYDPQRTLRVHLTDKVIASCASSIEALLGISVADQLLWYSEGRVTNSSTFRIQSQVTEQTEVKTLCRDGEYASFKECCLLVLDAKCVAMCGDPGEQPVLLTHHKLYDPVKLKVSYVGPIVIYGNNRHVREAQDSFCSLLPTENRPVNPKAAQYFIDLEEGSSFSSAVMPASGDIYVWQEQLSTEALQDVLYPSIEHFQHFLKNRVPVELHAIAPPFNLIQAMELSWDMSHTQLQKYVAKLVGETNPEKVRFARHNPETKQPFFAKIKRDAPNLRSMLTVNHEVFRQLYFEVCPFTVSEIEQSNSLQFEYFSEAVKCISSHWILMPKTDGCSILEVLQRCLIDIHDSAATAGRSPSKEGGDGGESMDEPVEARDLRLVDVWKGRIYNVYDVEMELPRGPFEESAEYRVEKRPRSLASVDLQRQMLISFQHFSRGAGGQVNCHGDPFSMWVDMTWCFEEVRLHINKKLNVSDQATIDWKPCLCRVNALVELKLDVPLEGQLFAFADRQLYQPNQKDPKQMAFIGLEHSPLPHARRPPRREERSLRIYN